MPMVEGTPAKFVSGVEHAHLNIPSAFQNNQNRLSMMKMYLSGGAMMQEEDYCQLDSEVIQNLQNQ